ncbi:MAG: hypothetical protein LCH54_15505 [Bacteroidetes bacterium]|nr:hypothetical protein [Bacteroidota bacterium]
MSQKIYKFDGVEYKLRPCSAKRAADFQKEYEIVDNQAMKGDYAPMAILAKTIVERVNPKSTTEEPDWVLDIDMKEIRGILLDFFLSFNPKLASALILLNELSQDEIRTAVSTPNPGQLSGDKNKA